MKTRLRDLAVSFVASAGLLLVGAVPLASAASGSDTCAWTGGGSDDNWSTTANWNNCGGGAPASGDSLVFNNTSATGDIDTVANISNLTLNSITFTGSGSYSVYIGGAGFSISGGITNTTTNDYAVYIRDTATVTLTADQSFGRTSGYTTSSNAPKLVIGSHSLNAASVSGFIVEGDGEITASNEFSFGGLSPNFSGSLTLQNDTYFSIKLPTESAGTASITIDEGARMAVYTGAGVTEATIPNDITVGGVGPSADARGAIISCLGNAGPMSPCTPSATTVTLSGLITLTANTKFANAAYDTSQTTAPEHTATFALTGTLNLNGFSLDVIENSNTKITGSAYDEAEAGETEEEAPDTGFAFVGMSPLQTLGITALTAGALFFISRRVLAKSGVRR